MRVRDFLGALIVAATLTPAAALAGGYRCPTSVVLYQGPGHHYRHVATAPAGAPLKVYHCAGWCEVSWGPYRGWVQTKYFAKGYQNVARRLTITPAYGDLGGPYVPTYVKPRVAFLSSQTVDPWGQPNGRVWYYNGRYLDRPDTFRFVTR
ncbi:MAG: SH3 domain-containing protein [Hyphomicrobium sp.]